MEISPKFPFQLQVTLFIFFQLCNNFFCFLKKIVKNVNSIRNDVTFSSTFNSLLLGKFQLRNWNQLVILVNGPNLPRPTNTSLDLCSTCTSYQLIKQDPVNAPLLQGSWGSFNPLVVFTFSGETGSKQVGSTVVNFVWSSNAATQTLAIVYFNTFSTTFAHYSIQGTQLTLIEGPAGNGSIPNWNSCASCMSYTLNQCPSLQMCPYYSSEASPSLFFSRCSSLLAFFLLSFLLF